MKRVCFVLSLVLALSAVLLGSAQAAVLLDDFSTDQSSKYSSYMWYNSPAPTFAIADGMLVPSQGSTVAGGLYWVNGAGGERLNPGDKVSMDIQGDHNNADGQAHFGLALATSSTSTNPYHVMANYAGSTLGWRAELEGGDWVGTTYASLDGSNFGGWNTLSRLTLTRGTGVDQNQITWAFSKVGETGLVGTGTAVLSINASDALVFGTACYPGGGSAHPAWDNLTYVPEPSAIVLLTLGLIGLMAYAWRKRK